MKSIMKFLYVSFLCSAIVLCGCSSVSKFVPEAHISPSFQKGSYGKLVILVVDNSRYVQDRGMLRQIEDEFMKVAMGKGYDVVTRSDKEKLLEEIHFENSIYASEIKPAELGRMFNVPGVLIVSVNNVSTREYTPLLRMEGQRYYATQATLSTRFVATESAQVLFLLNHTIEMKGNDRQQGDQAAALCAREIAAILP